MISSVRILCSRTHQQLVVVLMIAALLFATTEFLSHVDTKAQGSRHATHCELCLAWGSGAASPAAPALAVRFVLLARLAYLDRDVPAPTQRRLARAHRSRAPPSFT